MNAPVCPQHNLTAVWKEGNSKTTGKAYAFWSCPVKKSENGGEYCSYKFPKPSGPTEKFNDQLNQSTSLSTQNNKDVLITRTAVAKSLIEAGMTFSQETAAELEKWVRLIEGKMPVATGVKKHSEEINIDEIPF